jgi:hypothetical protein
MLEEVASCSVTSLSKPWLLAVAAVVLVASFATADDRGKGWIGGILLALGFAVVYYVTRRQVVSVASAGAAINIDIAGTDERAVHDLINSIEAAKEAKTK